MLGGARFWKSWRYAGLLVLLLIVAGTVLIGGTLRRIQSEPVLVTPATVAADLSPAEYDFVAYVEPRLRTLQRESDDLAALGRSRSRDAVALLEGQRHVEKLIAELSEFIISRGVPSRFQQPANEFAVGARDALQSIRDGRAAVTRLDWDGVANAVERFAGAADQFDAASESLAEAEFGPS